MPLTRVILIVNHNYDLYLLRLRLMFATTPNNLVLTDYSEHLKLVLYFYLILNATL